MISVRQTPDSNIVEVEITDSITAQEFDDALAALKEAIGQHGHIRVLELVGELDTPPIPWNRFWADIKFGFEHLSDITHAAVVADQGWIATYVNMLNPLFKAEFKPFKHAELAAARAWLEQAA
ncbi:MAG: STAS/SEC14 domain-containing protein [Thiohalocapsa sp.]|uniref:STAS/SEC14 domain-containing protein n=1 Tax=Thiohalocapsa sp. TaxID=2497641 RepID=UPI0025ECACD7|nr:STAS/SEC14 domain-containing protein [Thiohalocapsa sp.]MCG6943177.1 STAS/SEC14 domain-containing protein [Thiohalocapsa sp.]